VCGKIVGLLKSTFEIENLLEILELEGFLHIYNLLSLDDKKEISISILNKLSKDNVKITSMGEVEQLFEIITPLTREQESEQVDQEFQEEQELVTKMLHLFQNEDADELFKMYSIARKQFGQGGLNRIIFTLPPLIFSYLKIAPWLKSSNGKFTDVKVFQYVTEILRVLGQRDSKMAFKLFLQTVLCANRCENTTALYDCISEAFILYEEEDSKSQPQLLSDLINVILLVNISEEHFETLSTKLCQYSAKLLRKSDQSRCGALCSLLFWPQKSTSVSTQKSLECLKWSLNIIKSTMENEQIPLFVEILNIYLYQFQSNNEHLSPDLINKIIAIISEKIQEFEDESLITYFKNTMDSIRFNKSVNKAFSKIVLN
jgi:vacuolar protein sorting-associated protein 35